MLGKDGLEVHTLTMSYNKDDRKILNKILENLKHCNK